MGEYANKPKRHNWVQRGQWWFTFCATSVRCSGDEYRANVRGGYKVCKRCQRIQTPPPSNPVPLGAGLLPLAPSTPGISTRLSLRPQETVETR